MDETNERRVAGRPVDRRTMLKGIGAGALAVGAGQVVSQLAFAKPAFGATIAYRMNVLLVSSITARALPVVAFTSMTR